MTELRESRPPDPPPGRAFPASGTPEEPKAPASRRDEPDFPSIRGAVPRKTNPMGPPARGRSCAERTQFPPDSRETPGARRTQFHRRTYCNEATCVRSCAEIVADFRPRSRAVLGPPSAPGNAPVGFGHHVRLALSIGETLRSRRSSQGCQAGTMAMDGRDARATPNSPSMARPAPTPKLPTAWIFLPDGRLARRLRQVPGQWRRLAFAPLEDGRHAARTRPTSRPRTSCC